MNVVTSALRLGRKPEDEDEAAGVQGAIRAAQKAKATSAVGYSDRTELVRKALKFYCDLGAHPEAAETHRNNARAALVMKHGLLESVTRRELTVRQVGQERAAAG